MSTKEFENVKRIFHMSGEIVKNDASLGKWLIQRGANLVILGLEELENPMPETV